LLCEHELVRGEVASAMQLCQARELADEVAAGARSCGDAVGYRHRRQQQHHPHPHRSPVAGGRCRLRNNSSLFEPNQPKMRGALCKTR
jgi:hypothetical protein